MEKVSSKWKRFSVNVHLSSYDENIPAEAVFDLLMLCASEEEWDKDIAQMDIDIWHPFENMGWEELRDSIESTAQTAQQYAEVQE